MIDPRAVAADEIVMALHRLIRMAQVHGLDLLAYMLDMARIEAEREAGKKPGDGGDGGGR